MGARGPAPKLRAVREREGNPGKRPLPEGVRLPPEIPAEPDWRAVFPMDPWGRGPAMRLRKTAAAQWALLSRYLGSQGILAAVDAAALELACSAFAIYRESMREARLGDALKWFGAWVSVSGKLGLTPAARDQLNPREGVHAADDLFDG